RIGHRDARAAEHARQRADQIEVTEQRARPGLLEAEAVARRGALGRVDRRLSPLTRLARRLRLLDSDELLLGTHLREEDEALLAHLIEVAGDATVVANERALVGLRLF